MTHEKKNEPREEERFGTPPSNPEVVLEENVSDPPAPEVEVTNTEAATNTEANDVVMAKANVAPEANVVPDVAAPEANAAPDANLQLEANASAPVLVPPDFSKDFVIYCDASRQGLGCILMQDRHVIAYASRQLHPT